MKKQLLLVLTIASLVQPAKAFDVNAKTIGLFTAALGLGGVMAYKYWRGTVAAAEQARQDRLAQEAAAEQARLAEETRLNNLFLGSIDNRATLPGAAAQPVAAAAAAEQAPALSDEKIIFTKVTIGNTMMQQSALTKNSFENISLAELTETLNARRGTPYQGSYIVEIQDAAGTLIFRAAPGRRLDDNINAILDLARTQCGKVSEGLSTPADAVITGFTYQPTGDENRYNVSFANGTVQFEQA